VAGDILHAWKRREIHISFWLEGLKERDYFEDLGVDGRIILKWNLNRIGWLGLDLSESG
jgi:hypothetical protein